jgi:hypothetical protein
MLGQAEEAIEGEVQACACAVAHRYSELQRPFAWYSIFLLGVSFMLAVSEDLFSDGMAVMEAMAHTTFSLRLVPG